MLLIMMIDTHVEHDHAFLRLLLAGGSTRPRRLLLDRFRTPCAALDVGTSAWLQAGCNSRQCAHFAQPDQTLLERSLRWLADPEHHLIGWHQADYPPLLRYIANPPLGLFITGDPMLLWHPAIAIVGTRLPSRSGLDCAYRFAHALASSGLSIVSGMALGIDACAHRAALATSHPYTVAVLGCGPDIVYPNAHRLLHRQIADYGAVVSEYPPGTSPRRGHFPARNRLIAGLSLGTLVVEATRRSGALITAHLAHAAHRDVFAIPGPLHHPMAQGCHALIREGANLVEHPNQLIEGLGALPQVLARAIRARLADMDNGILQTKTLVPTLSNPDYTKVWEALGHDSTTMDQIVQRCGLTVSTVSSILVSMEMDGYVSADQGRYCRIA